MIQKSFSEKICIGTANFGQKYGLIKNHMVSEKEIAKILDYCNKNNIYKIDTAIGYGDAEKKLGNIGIKNWKVVSKFPPIINDAIGDRSTPLFDLICQKNYFDYLIDINVIYHNKGNIIKGDNYFMDYLDPNVKAEVEIKIYNLPKEDYEDWLLKLHQNKDLCLETIKKDIINNNK